MMQISPLSRSNSLPNNPEQIFGIVSYPVFTSRISTPIFRPGNCAQSHFTVSSPSVVQQHLDENPWWMCVDLSWIILPRSRRTRRMPTVLREMWLIRTSIEPFGETPTHNNPQNRNEARERLFHLLTSNIFISEIL